MIPTWQEMREKYLHLQWSLSSSFRLPLLHTLGKGCFLCSIGYQLCLHSVCWPSQFFQLEITRKRKLYEILVPFSDDLETLSSRIFLSTTLSKFLLMLILKIRSGL